MSLVPLLASAMVAWSAPSAAPAASSAPAQITVAAVAAPAQRETLTTAARRYASFWNTGDEALARQALAPDFVDRTLPPGRAQGVQGALDASRTFRAAVPDLSCAVEQLIVAGDRVVAHLHFRGHFSGRFAGRQGRGQSVDFIATDIYRVAGGRIAENWHIEDNLTLLTQLGVVTP
ncbi:ester cyclase [Dyella sp. KULCS107]|uniref:ester cyclase n=1 Tax=Dyella sp. KULCS107 TaxID=3422216 RepID=UPI003D6FE620